MFEERRGVSETIGFVFAFALIVSTSGIVYTLGTGGLEQARDAERLNNAERAMDVLAQNMDDLSRRSVPSRATEIRLAQASLYFGEPVRFNVSGTATGATGSDFTAEFNVTPIVYEGGANGDTRLVFVNGAVIRDQREGEVAIVEPGVTLSSEAVLFPLIGTVADDGTERVGGTSTVLVRGRVPLTPTNPASPELVASEDAPYDVTVEVETPRTTAWERILSREDTTCSTSGDVVTCDVSTDRVSVTLLRVFLEFE